MTGTDRIRGVDIDFIDAFNESARSTYPDEFLCMTREIGMGMRRAR